MAQAGTDTTAVAQNQPSTDKAVPEIDLDNRDQDEIENEALHKDQLCNVDTPLMGEARAFIEMALAKSKDSTSDQLSEVSERKLKIVKNWADRKSSETLELDGDLFMPDNDKDKLDIDFTAAENLHRISNSSIPISEIPKKDKSEAAMFTCLDKCGANYYSEFAMRNHYIKAHKHWYYCFTCDKTWKHWNSFSAFQNALCSVLEIWFVKINMVCYQVQFLNHY